MAIASEIRQPGGTHAAAVAGRDHPSRGRQACRLGPGAAAERLAPQAGRRTNPGVLAPRKEVTDEEQLLVAVPFQEGLGALDQRAEDGLGALAPFAEGCTITLLRLAGSLPLLRSLSGCLASEVS